MRFLHTSDLQIGKVFGNFSTEESSALQDARQASIRALGQAAIEAQASAVLIAGDIYEKQQMSQQALARAVENMRPFTNLKWHLMPGNHDRYQENGLWDRLARMQLPENVTLHIRPGAVQIAEDDGKRVFLLPAPLKFTSNPDDLTTYMDTEATPEGAIRLGIAHGSVQGFGSEGEANNYISPTRPESAGLSYLAMGDWHRQIRIGDRCWYSGTPEPDQFKLPPNATTSRCNGGSALIVDVIGPNSTPSVTSVPTGRYQWHLVEKTLTENNQVDTLESELRSLGADLSCIALDLRARGALSLAGRRSFEEKILQHVGAALRALRFDEGGLVLNPTDQDLDEIDRSGFVRVAADRLKAMAADSADSNTAQLASQALKRLYLEHLRQEVLL
jgi:DNA repair exonuclease SbcCD nuclease subunit